MNAWGKLSSLVLLVALLTGCITIKPGGSNLDSLLGETSVPNTKPSNLPTAEETAKADAKIKADADAAATAKNAEIAKKKYLNLTPMTALSQLSVDKDKVPVDYADRYVRIKFEAGSGCLDLHVRNCIVPDGTPTGHDTALPDGSTTMGYEETGLFSRYFTQPHRAVTLSANVSAGAFIATVPLLSLSHNAGKDGDAWNRTIYSRAEQFPWFLVKADGSNAILSTRFTLSATKSIQFQGAVVGLNAAVSLARQLAPQGTLVTALTEASAKTRADALDTTISNLFGMTIAEQHWVDSDFKRWSYGDALRLDVSIPSESDSVNGDVKGIGYWTIALEDPRPSIFVDVRVCPTTVAPTCIAGIDEAIAAVVAQVKAANVLSFNVIPLAPPNTSLGSIATNISQHETFAASLASIAADKNSPLVAAPQLCKDIRQWMSSLGFSSLDQEIIVWAVATGMSIVPKASGDTIVAACNSDIVQKLVARDATVAARKPISGK